MKRLLSLLLATVLCLGMSSVAFAAETPETSLEGNTAENVVEENQISDTANGEIVPFAAETWGKSTSFKKVGTFTMEGNNLTPVKTIGATGSLSLRLDDVQAVGEMKNIHLIVQIKDHNTQKVLKEWSIYEFWHIQNHVSSSLNVKKGQKIQIYFKAFNANTGLYDDNQLVKITYSYRLK